MMSDGIWVVVGAWEWTAEVKCKEKSLGLEDQGTKKS